VTSALPGAYEGLGISPADLGQISGSGAEEVKPETPEEPAADDEAEDGEPEDGE
jgi:hypothetical protein